jgi:hypothetical protein
MAAHEGIGETMGKGRVRAASAVVAGTAIASVLIVVDVGTAPVASAAACSATRTSTMNVTGRANEYEYVTYISNGGVVTTSPRMMIRGNVNTGYSAVRPLTR